MVLGIDIIREGILKQREGLKLQDEELAVVQAAMKDNPLRALSPLLAALMAGNKATPPSGDGHVAKCKATVPIHQPPTTTPSISTGKTSTISEEEPPSQKKELNCFL